MKSHRVAGGGGTQIHLVETGNPRGRPILFIHGTEDAVVKPAAVDQHRAAIAHAQIQMMANAGHACFWDDAAAFNRRLRAFAESL